MTTRHAPPPCICKVMPAGHKAAAALVKYIKAAPRKDVTIHVRRIDAAITTEKP